MEPQSTSTPKSYLNPYLAGFLLGLTLLASFLVLGAGLGASGGLARMAAFAEGALAPSHTLASEYFGAWGQSPLGYYLVLMLAGAFLGGLVSAMHGGRLRLAMEKGRAASARLRAVYALGGGILVGLASRLAQGCTSGQALTGGALLLSGSLLFLVFAFGGGYAAAYFVRRQWDD
ncbi:MAG: YeeE/YedE family protein [Syntrophobacteraceae bacterium]|nr:YeeE/YedE family protein [Syntrophobacteraceae bacterium]